MVLPSHTVRGAGVAQRLLALLYAMVVVLAAVSCTVVRFQGRLFFDSNPNGWLSAWYRAEQTGLFQFTDPAEPLTAVSGTFMVGEQKAEIVFRLASCPVFDTKVVYGNRVMTMTDTMETVRRQFGVPAAELNSWQVDLVDHNGAFQDELGTLLESFDQRHIAPDIHWGYVLSGHGGSSGDYYSVGDILVVDAMRRLVLADRTEPDFLQLDSCNMDGANLPVLVQSCGINPVRFVFTPAGFVTCEVVSAQAREAALKIARPLFAPVVEQYGLHETVDGKDRWVLQRVDVRPIFSRNDVLFFADDLPSHVQALLNRLGLPITVDTDEARQLCLRVAYPLTVPVVHNHTKHHFVTK